MPRVASIPKAVCVGNLMFCIREKNEYFVEEKNTNFKKIKRILQVFKGSFSTIILTSGFGERIVIETLLSSDEG